MPEYMLTIKQKSKTKTMPIHAPSYGEAEITANKLGKIISISRITEHIKESKKEQSNKRRVFY